MKCNKKRNQYISVDSDLGADCQVWKRPKIDIVGRSLQVWAVKRVDAIEWHKV